MPDKKPPENPWITVFFVVGIFLFLLALWIARGGPKDTSAIGGLFIGSPLGTSTTLSPYGLSTPTVEGGGETNSSVATQNIPQLAGYPRSQFSGDILIENDSGAQANTPSGEYLTLYASPTNASAITISGWKLESIPTGTSAIIPGGVITAVSGTAMTTAPIALVPGQSAIISTGRSPIGVSFLENECSGYLSQFQEFVPPLSLSCPFPEDELTPQTQSVLAQDESCVAAVSDIAPCQTLTSAPTGVSSACSEFMTSSFTYNGCVAAHQSDSDFLGRQWRVYLGESQELWNNQSDVIALLDTEGNLVTAISY